MRHRIRLRSILLLSALPLALLVGCGGDDLNAPTTGVAQVEIHPGPATLVFIGERYQLAATARDAGGVVVQGVSITWTSSDTSIVAVAATGVLTARRDGQASVTATAAGVSGQVLISVDVSQAASRCTNCHGPLQVGAHDLGMFSGATCPSCHLRAFESSPGDAHQLALPGHAAVARGFGLVGVHDTLSCTACHQPSSGAPRFQPADTADCYACHEDDFQRRHAGSNFPTTCPICHSTDSFRGAAYDHQSSTAKFRLIEVHTTLPCSSCHAPTGAPLFSPRGQNDCVACHQADYQRQHAGSGYPPTCIGCHTPTQWAGASFNHTTASGGKFTLVGTHLTKPCTACHDATTGVPKFSPRGQNDCVACHQADYQRQHAGSGYPTTCLTCHTTTAFRGATFNHDANFFPINSGEHRGRWNSCATCHTVPADFSQYSCRGCHKESHGSEACATCHRRP
jgi:hypothetical protein